MEALRAFSDVSLSGWLLSVLLLFVGLLCLGLAELILVKVSGIKEKSFRIMVNGGVIATTGSISGLGAMGNGFVRFIIYRRLGAKFREIGKMFVVMGFSFWTGFTFFIAAHLLLLVITGNSDVFGSSSFVYILLIALLIMNGVIYGLLIPFRFFKILNFMPALPVSLSLAIINMFDWFAIVTGLYVLFPDKIANFFEFSAVYGISLMAGFLSMLPGGLGVSELVAVVLTKQTLIESAATTGYLFVHRLIHFFIPGLIGLLFLWMNVFTSESLSFWKKDFRNYRKFIKERSLLKNAG